MRTRAEQAERVRELRQQGLTHREVAQLIGLSRSYVADIDNDPLGLKVRARRESYAGTCVDCGRPTSGGDGPAKAPQRCNVCRGAHIKYWTAERVIDAIQEWARRRGRPPLATEWIRRTDDPDGYAFPPRTAVYKSNQNASSPFARWADAIEAAGFPRPYHGWKLKDYERINQPMPAQHTRPYIVFVKNGDGSLQLVGEVTAETNQKAVEMLATEAGEYAAIAVGSLQLFDLRPKLVASRQPRMERVDAPA